MSLLSRKQATQNYPDKHGSPSGSDSEQAYPHAHKEGLAGDHYVGDDGDVYDEDLHVPCPEHTTEARLLAKIDFRIIPALCVLYLLAFLDRVNIANARLFNLEEDLGMNPDSLQYSTAVVIFFIPYVLFEIPSNVLLKRFKPSIWLSGCMFMFGLMLVLQGLVQNYAGLLTVRFFLGLFETGMFPGCFYLIGMWYRRSEAQKRYSFFFSSTTLAGAFGGLLAAAIGKMQGIRGYSGWRWIFILEGLLTCLISFLMFFIMSDFPEDARWLKPSERAYIKSRLEADQGKSALERPITLRDIGNVFKDYKIIIGGFMYFGLIVPAYGYAYFAPSIIKNFGYSTIKTQLYSVPPWAAAFGFSMLIAWASDRSRHRFGFVMLPICVSITGFAMLLAVSPASNAAYAALFLVTSGTYSAMPIIVCWFTMNLGGHHRRSVGTGYQIGFGNIGGIIASFTFLMKDAPRYTPGYSICIAFVIISTLASIIYFFAVVSQNRKKAKMPKDLSMSEADKAALGDLGPDYRYQL